MGNSQSTILTNNNNSTGPPGSRYAMKTRGRQISPESSFTDEESPQRQPIKIGCIGDSRSKTCCFCWCCCCSCSCLSVKPVPEEPIRPVTNNDHQNRLDIINSDERIMPSKISLDDAGRWGESFDYLMQSKDGQCVFREFLKMEYSEENLLFWLACEDLRKEASPDVVEEKARLIYEDYISILSAKEVSLDSRVREIINGKMVEPTAGTFDEAQLQIYTLMHRDSYPRFLNSRVYRDILDRAKS